MAQHNILVVGGAGKSGTQVVEAALAAGHAVTAFVRNPAKAAHLPPAAKIFEGDARDAAAIAGAVPGHDVVIITVGGGRTFVSAEAARNVVKAMKGFGVKRVILLSAYGIGDSAHGFHGFMLSKVLSGLNSDKVASEAALESSGLDWTAVRPPVLADGPAQGGVKAAEGVTINGFQSLRRSDLAAFMINEIDERRFVGKKPIVYRS